MLKKYQKNFFLTVIIFYFLILLQNSFLSHFTIKGVYPNLILIAVLLLNLFEKSEKKYFGQASGFIGGFFLDIFSSLPLGIATFSLGFTAIILKRILQNFKNIDSLLVLFLLIFSVLLYEFLTLFLNFLYKIPTEGTSAFNYTILIGIIYNSLLAFLGFLLFKFLKK